MVEELRSSTLRMIERGESNYVLRDLTFNHTKLILRWRNDPENAKFFFGTGILTEKTHEAWLARQIEIGRDKNWVIESICGTSLGTVSIYNIDNNGSAEFGRLLIGDASSRGKGIGLFATLLALKAASELGIERVHLAVFSDNIAAVRLYERAGFVIKNQESNRLLMEMRLRSQSPQT